MIHEGYGILGPTGLVLTQLHTDQVRQPGDVLDFELLKPQVGVECTEMELIFEGHREAARSLSQHDLIELWLAALSFVTLILHAQVDVLNKLSVG